MGLRHAALLGLVAHALAGCGGEERQPAPRQIAAPARDAAAVVDRLDRAVRARDFATVCERLLTAAARERSGGARCAATLRAAARDVAEPRIRVLAVELTGRRAEARIRTRAAGQAPVDETLQLVRDGDGYRIASLSR